jgi:hypothetical protein
MNDEKSEKKKQKSIDFLKSLILQHYFRNPCGQSNFDSLKIHTSPQRG